MKPSSQSTALHLDPEKYEKHLAAFDLNPSEKQELLEALFGIAVHFVDQAFKPCGKLKNSDQKQTLTDNDLIHYQSSQQQEDA